MDNKRFLEKLNSIKFNFIVETFLNVVNKDNLEKMELSETDDSLLEINTHSRKLTIKASKYILNHFLNQFYVVHLLVFLRV